MPLDEMIPPLQPPPPSRDQILANLRQQNTGHLIEQILGLEADKAVLTNEITQLRQRIAELERLEPQWEAATRG